MSQRAHRVAQCIGTGVVAVCETGRRPCICLSGTGHADRGNAVPGRAAGMALPAKESDGHLYDLPARCSRDQPGPEPAMRGGGSVQRRNSACTKSGARDGRGPLHSMAMADAFGTDLRADRALDRVGLWPDLSTSVCDGLVSLVEKTQGDAQCCIGSSARESGRSSGRDGRTMNQSDEMEGDAACRD